MKRVFITIITLIAIGVLNVGPVSAQPRLQVCSQPVPDDIYVYNSILNNCILTEVYVSDCDAPPDNVTEFSLLEGCLEAYPDVGSDNTSMYALISIGIAAVALLLIGVFLIIHKKKGINNVKK